MLKWIPSLHNVQFTDWIFYFAIYSFIGWLLQSAYRSISNRHWSSAGLLMGPVMPGKGIMIIIILLISQQIEFTNNTMMLLSLFFAFAAVFIICGPLGLMVSEFMLGVPCGDKPPQKMKTNILQLAVYSFLWAFIAMALVFVVQPWVMKWVHAVPHGNRRLITSAILIVFAIDSIVSLQNLKKLKIKMQAVGDALLKGNATPTEEQIDQAINNMVADCNVSQRHILSAYPRIIPTLKIQIKNRESMDDLPKKQIKAYFFKKNQSLEYVSNENEEKSFAHGLNFYKLVWVFTIACIIGYVVETLFQLLYFGVIQSRQGMIYGPFSQIYGIGAVLMVVGLYPFRKQKNWFIFLGTALIGGAFETVASWIQQNFFGSVSWNYQDAWTVPLFGGRTCLAFMFLWGVLGVIFIRFIYPWLSNWIEQIPNKQGVIVTWAVFCMFVANGFISGSAVYRWNQREKGVPATTTFEHFLDDAYPNAVLQEVYANMKPTSKEQDEGNK